MNFLKVVNYIQSYIHTLGLFHENHPAIYFPNNTPYADGGLIYDTVR